MTKRTIAAKNLDLDLDLDIAELERGYALLHERQAWRFRARLGNGAMAGRIGISRSIYISTCRLFS